MPDAELTPRARGGAGLGSVSISSEFPDVSRFFSVREIQDIINKVLKAAKIAGVSVEGAREVARLACVSPKEQPRKCNSVKIHAAPVAVQDEGDNLQHKGDIQANLVKV